MVRILDLYSGVGGLSLGFVLGLKGVEVRGLDIDRYAVSTYNYNFSGGFAAFAEVQDVLKWEPNGDYDMVMGGVPCQPYSLANSRRRGTEHELFPTLPRFFEVVSVLKPKVFLMENVKGLNTRTHRHLLDKYLSLVTDDYAVAINVLNAAYYGVPQRRERLFVLGIRKDLSVKPSFPSRTHAEREKITLTGKLFKWVTVREAIGDLLSVVPDFLVVSERTVDRIRSEREDTSRHRGRMEFPDSLDKPSRTISSHTVQGSKRETIIISIKEHQAFSNVRRLSSSHDWSSRIVPKDKPSYTITSWHRDGQLVEIPSEHVVRYHVMDFSDDSLSKHRPQALDKPSSTIRASFSKVPPDATLRVGGRLFRRLSVRECMRLQSFPDWFSFPEGISLSRKYRLVGEAVSPILAYRLAVHIGKLMGWGVKEPPSPVAWNLPYFRRAFQDYFVGDSVG